MQNTHFNKLEDAYLGLLKHLISVDPNEMGDREDFGLTLTIEDINSSNPSTNFKNIQGRDINYVFQESFAVWMLSGSNSVNHLQFLTGSTKKYDGSFDKNNSGRNVLYPRRIDNQLDEIVEELSENPMSRRATLMILDERDQEIMNQKRHHGEDSCNKEYPCTIAVNYWIRDNKLNSDVMMRSNNAVTTICYDFTNFAHIQQYISKVLSVECGKMIYHMSNAHIFGKDYDRSLNIVNNNKH